MNNISFDKISKGIYNQIVKQNKKTKPRSENKVRPLCLRRTHEKNFIFVVFADTVGNSYLGL